MVRERSAERRSKKLGHWASPTISRAYWNRTLAATGSPIVRSAPRTRTAGANPASKWRSLAPCSLAAPTKDSRFIGWPSWVPASATMKLKFHPNYLPVNRLSHACISRSPGSRKRTECVQDWSADSPVRAFLASDQVRADKAVRAPAPRLSGSGRCGSQRLFGLFVAPQFRAVLFHWIRL